MQRKLYDHMNVYIVCGIRNGNMVFSAQNMYILPSQSAGNGYDAIHTMNGRASKGRTGERNAVQGDLVVLQFCVTHKIGARANLKHGVIENFVMNI